MHHTDKNPVAEIEHCKNLRESIEQHLHQFERTESTDKSLTMAAVVIGVSASVDSNTATALLTLRSSKLRKHAGQFALPGGKIDPGESVVDAALRELAEELGIQQNSDSVLGILDDMPTQSGFVITPVVVWIDDLSQLKPNPDEVARVYQIPLLELQELDLQIGFEKTAWKKRGSENESSNITRGEYIEQRTSPEDEEIMSMYLPTVGTTIYSPTAAIIYQFREVALLGKPTRVAHFGQPKFAWR